MKQQMKTTRKFRFVKIFLIFLFFMTNSQVYSQARNSAFYKKQGDHYLAQKNRSLALDQYRKSLTENPNYVPTLLAMAKLLRELGDLPLALENIEKAYALEPKNENVLLEKSEIFLAMLDSQSAQKVAQEGLKISPQKPDFHFILTRIYLLRGSVSLAQNRAERLIRSSPNFAQAYLVMGQILTEQNRFDKALEYYNKARLIEPKNPNVFVQMAMTEVKKIIYSNKDILQKGGDNRLFEDAISYLQNAIAYDKGHVDSNFIVGEIYALTGRCSQAIAFFNKVTEVNPKHQGALIYNSYCQPENSAKLLRNLLYQNQNDDLLRFSYEWSMLRAYSRREHPAIMEAVRYHLDNSKFLLSSNYLEANYELRWSEFLNPNYVSTRKMLMNHYRNTRDYENYLEQLNFLREREANQKRQTTYQDRFEQFLRERHRHIYYQAGVEKPSVYKSKTPVFVFFPSSKQPFSNYPFAGLALAESISFQLQSMGKVFVANYRQRQKIYQSLNIHSSLGQGVVYTPTNIANLQKVFPRPHEQTSSYGKVKIPPSQSLRYVLDGKFHEIAEGLEVSVHLVDLKTGRVFAPYSVRASGRGYLRKIAMSIARHVYKNIPTQGYIIKINNYDIVINMGERDGVQKEQKFDVVRNKKVVSQIKVNNIGKDLSIAKPLNEADIFVIQNGDAIVPAIEK